MKLDPLVDGIDPPVLGPFELLAVLGNGGMGRAYLARLLPLENFGPELTAAYFLAESSHERENTLVAVKTISPAYLLKDDGQSEQQKRARFAQEVSTIQAVVSDRIPSLIAAAPEAETAWLAIDYVHGPNLSDAVEKLGPFAPGPYLALGLALVEAVGAIHGAGLLHRDIKPMNIVLGPTGPVLLDFGLAVLADRSSSKALTAAVGFGSKGYMPLEQTRDLKHVGTPADIYSLGATLYFAACGRSPYPNIITQFSPSYDGIDHTFLPLLARILVHDESKRPSLVEVEQGLREILIMHGITEEEAAGQLAALVEGSGLIPELPAQAVAEGPAPAVQAAAQRAVDAGEAPDAPWGPEAGLFEELFGIDGDPDGGSPAPEVPAVATGPVPPDAPAPVPPTGYTPTVIDPAEAVTHPLPSAASAAGAKAPPTTTSQGSLMTAPPIPAAALRVVKQLRRAYGRSRIL